MSEQTPSARLGAATSFRILLLVGGGTIFCSATVACIPIVVVHMLRSGAVHGLGDVAGEAVFFVLSLVVLGIVLRAWRRLRAGRARSDERFYWLGRAVPGFIAIGVGVGIWFALRVNHEHDVTVRVLARITCSKAIGFDADDTAVEACVSVGLECNALEDAERRAKHIGIGAYVGDPPSVTCVRERLGVASP